MKKGSLEVGVNFLVVIIICLALLGIGIWLMSKFIIIGKEQLGKVDEANQKRLVSLLSTGAQVVVIPSIATVARGEIAKFSLGVSNELDAPYDFSIYVEEKGSNPAYVQPQYSLTSVHLENNKQYFWLIGITIPKEDPKGTYIFNIYVCKDYSCSQYPLYTDDPTNKYGELQQIQVNIR